HDAAHLELAIHAPRTSGQLAAIAYPHGRSIARQLGKLQARREPLLGRLRAVVGDGLQPRPTRGETLRHFLALLVALHCTRLRHSVFLLPARDQLANGMSNALKGPAP